MIMLSGIAAICMFAGGCAMLDVATQVGSAVGVATGAITPDQAESLQKTGGAVSKALERFTPENEYYIGRAVTATILADYRVLANAALNEYLNLVGQTLAAFSDKPETFAGYHFAAADSDEINAFAAPGGFVVVTKGLLRCCRNEDALAAVLAHEVAHIQLEHGIQAIKKSRTTTAFAVLGAEAVKNFGGQELADLTEAFEGSISDIVSTLVNSGYSRKQEYEADRTAVVILKQAGYNPNGLREMLEEMAKRLPPEGHGFARTHPPPELRIKEIAPLLSDAPPMASHPGRQSRFSKAMAGI